MFTVLLFVSVSLYTCDSPFLFQRCPLIDSEVTAFREILEEDGVISTWMLRAPSLLLLFRAAPCSDDLMALPTWGHGGADTVHTHRQTDCCQCVKENCLLRGTRKHKTDTNRYTLSYSDTHLPTRANRPGTQTVSENSSVVIQEVFAHI